MGLWSHCGKVDRGRGVLCGVLCGGCERALLCRQQDQRELRRQRKRLRDLCAAGEGGEGLLEAEDVEELCRELAREQITALCGDVEAAKGEDAQRDALEAALNQMYEARGEVRADLHACVPCIVAARAPR